jgi:DNA-binding transcriptional LysR family regulator
MVSLNRFKIFIAVVDAGTLTAAAHALGQSKAVVSFNLKQLEAELGVALLTRSTRSLVLTEAGRRFYHDCLHVELQAQEAIDRARMAHQGLQGTLRLSTTTEYGQHRIVPALAEFSRQHPYLQIHHSSSSQYADLISERFDVAIRLGKLKDSSYKAGLIEHYPIWPVASAAYLQNSPRGSMTTLEDLSQADWLGHSQMSMPFSWLVKGVNGPEAFELKVQPKIVSDSASVLLTFVHQDCGVALLPKWLVEQDVASGRLLHLLPEYQFPSQSVYAVYPHVQHLPEKVRCFIDFVRTFVV